MPEKAVQHLVIGAARSGKSQHAERCALSAAASGRERPHYIATAEVLDEELQERVRIHRHRRRGHWQEHEVPMCLADALGNLCRPGAVVLVDCLGVWLSNCLHHDCWPQQRQALLDALPKLHGQLILVGSEVGAGIIPDNKLSRIFVDENGALNRELAARCQQVTALMAGIPLLLKSPSRAHQEPLKRPKRPKGC